MQIPIDEIATELQEWSHGIAAFISQWVNQHRGFASRVFYGETFSLLLLQSHRVLTPEVKQILLNEYDQKDKNAADFHWEFNNYALMELEEHGLKSEARGRLYPLRFKGTSCTNWTLLRCSVQARSGVDEERALALARKKLREFQDSSGLILDNPHIRSFQYHCFSAALLGELAQTYSDPELWQRFDQALSFIQRFILRNGDTLYIGRGQQQAFGYAALIYLLAQGYVWRNCDQCLNDLTLVKEFLSKHRRTYGSFPLVMNEQKEPIPKVADLCDPAYAGWYSYNNYFDYIPFLGVFLQKSASLLRQKSKKKVHSLTEKKRQDYRDSHLTRVSRHAYDAVIGVGCKRWSNELPVPYIVSGGRSITPCYGGEEVQESLCTAKGLPWPYHNLLSLSTRQYGYTFYISEDEIGLVSPYAFVRRKFYFERDRIVFTTRVFSFLQFTHQYFFSVPLEQVDDNVLVGEFCRIESNEALEYGGCEYSASGEMSLYRAHGKKSKISVIFG
jgi:energy-coupling factor transporter ATP-binding protein EcfA2